MNEANWPIRVGGIYAPIRTKHDHYKGCRVTEIDGDRIHYVLRTELSSGMSEHDAQSDSAAIFRKLYQPEDQSPIQQLVDALQVVDAILGDEDAIGTFSESHLLDISKRTIREALAKAETCGYVGQIVIDLTVGVN